MKIICVGRNYAKHIEELKNDIPEEPVIFLKPESSRLVKGKPFFYPDYSQDIHYEAEVVVKIHKNGRYIQEEFALDYFDELTLGIDLTARDIQSRLKSKGLPWELSKAFDNSAVIGKFISVDEVQNVENLNFSLDKNGKQVQAGNTEMMLFSISKLISFVSKYFFLKRGDLIFTGTPAGVGPIAIGDEYIGKIEGKELLKLKIR